MASTPAAQPDHFLLQGLDEVFTGEGGNAPALAGWLSYLTHPEEHAGPRRMSQWYGMNEVPDSVKEFKSKPGALEQQSGIHYEEKGSILRGLDGVRFFAHAQVLSGQRLGNRNAVGEPEGDLLGDMYRMMETVRYKAPRAGGSERQDSVAVWHNIREKCNRLFPSDPSVTPGWEGEAAGKVRPRYDQLTLWYEQYRDNALAEMMAHLGRFAAVIYTARTELNELMGKLVEALDEWATAEPVNVAFFLGVFGDILGFVLSPGIAAGVTTFYGLVTKVVEGVTKGDASALGYEANAEDGCYQMLDSFLTAGDQILRQAVGAVNDIVTHNEHGVESVHGGNWAPVPSWG
ncbi:hypothetical protein [Actinophytocola sediminis]